MKKANILLLLILIIILGSFLRVYKLSSESFWIDEAATVYTTKQDAVNTVKDIYITLEHASQYFKGGGIPPLYLVLANYWTKLVGLSEAKLRLLSAIFGIISVYVIFLVGKDMFDEGVGLVSAFLLSINYLQIYYSQEARPYSLGILLTLLSVYFLFNALNKKKIFYWIAHVVSSVLLIYTHYFGFLILLFESLFLLFYLKEYRNSVKSIFISALSIFVLYIPWLPVLVRLISGSEYLRLYLGKNVLWDLVKISVQFNSWITPDFKTRDALRPLYSSFNNLHIYDLILVSWLAWLTIICVISITILFGSSFFILLTSKNKKTNKYNFQDKKYVFLLMWLFTPISIPILITIIFPSSPIFGFVQYAIFASPAYYLIVSKGILQSRKYSIILGILLIISIPPLYSYYSNFDKQQWRESAEYFKTNRNSNEIIVTNVPANVLPLSYYYADMDNVVGIADLEDLKREIKDGNTVWLLYSSEKYGDFNGTIKSYLDASYKLNKKIEFTGIKIFYYTKNNYLQ